MLTPTSPGAVAHSDMPIKSGPTRLLPFSQKFEEGYLAARLPEFQALFLENYVSLPLSIGDGLFFNPALFHAAGSNETPDVLRSANLLQISSAMGKPMETIDTYPLIEKTWDALGNMFRKEGRTAELESLIGHVAEGYPFPTNMDNLVPGFADRVPESEQDALWKGLEEGCGKEEILARIRTLRNLSRA